MSRASLTEANAITGKPLDFFRDDYYQHFCGLTQFQWKLPCDPSELVYFVVPEKLDSASGHGWN